MKRALIIIISIIILSSNIYAETIPIMINYKGKIYNDGIPWNGPGFIKFAIVDTPQAISSTAITLWSNDNTSNCGIIEECEPDKAVQVSITEGIFHVMLGDENLTNMSSIDKLVFDNYSTYIRVWFSISEEGPFEPFEPDRQIVSVPFAIKAETAEVANRLANTGADSGLDADTVDGMHAADLSNEIDSDISQHAIDASAHHLKTTSFSELTDQISDTQIPDGIARDSEIIPAGTNNWVDTTGDTMTGDLTVQGTVNATTFKGDGSQLTGIAEAGGLANEGMTTIGADTNKDGNGEIVLQTRGDTRMTVSNNGNIGIGTTADKATLEVKGNIAKPLTGVVTVSQNAALVTGNGTSFTQEIKVGDAIKIGDEEFKVDAIIDDKTLTIDENHTAGAANATAYTDSDLFLLQDGQGVNKVTVDKTGNLTATSFAGDGSELTNLPPSYLGDSIESGEITDETITSADIANNAVNSAKIADETITDSDIAENADISPSKIKDTAWTSTNDGSGSTLDADLLDGQNSSAFMPAGTDNWVDTAGDTMTGNLTVKGIVDATTFKGDGSKLTGIAGAGGVANTGMTTIGADTDSDGVGEIVLQTRGDTRMTVSNNGNVGIGTTSPVASLNIKGSLSRPLTGIVTISKDSTSVRGNGTSFTQEIKVGDAIKIGDESFTVSSITNDIALEIDSPHSTGALDVTAYTDSDLFLLQTGDGLKKVAVDKSGNITAESFTGDGSGLTNLPPGYLGNSIESGEITDNAVNSAKIADGTITNADIADNAVIAGTKINPDFGGQSIVTTGKVDGRDISADGAKLDGITAGAADTTNDSWQGTGDVYTTSGNVGIGTTSPESPLHITSSNDAEVRLDPGNNSGWRVVGQWGLTQFDIMEVGKGSRLTITGGGNVGIGTTSPSGKLDVNGTIYQRGSQLHADYVFEPDYKLESIDDHSEFMWNNKHLKAIPKAKTDSDGQEIVEVGAHRKGIVEELEKAHIYIEQLNKQNKKLQQHLKTLEERLAKIEVGPKLMRTKE